MQEGACMHHLEQGIAHRDIKPENLLLCAGAGGLRVRLADFGIAQRRDAGAMHRMGTLDYMAPEVQLR